MIIKSRLSQDMYKYTMLQVAFSEFPDATAEYLFKCRNKDVNLLEFRKEIDEELDALCELKHTEDELEWLSGQRYYSPAFVDFLEDLTLKRRYIHTDEVGGELDIRSNGPWIQASQFEIFVLKIVHEVYTRNTIGNSAESVLKEGRNRLKEKVDVFNHFVETNGIRPTIIDFGGRRAFTTAWHETVVRNLAENNVIVGTSDMDIARRVGIKPIGTFAHEFVQTFQGLGICPVMESQSEAFQCWADVYRGDLGIALSDTLGDKKFLIDLDPYFAKLFDGVRHDSGDPFVWGDMMIAHYNAFGIDPMTKTLVFSDGLDFITMFRLAEYFNGKIKVSFGIGTYLSNDLGVPALQNVMKQIYCNGTPTAKISNDPDKGMCVDISYQNYLMSRLEQA